ncbi:MAG: hypothetical protein LBC97_07625, partial [Bifidobacteriaceae bacterium]|nr:hypothetical protein [Bifidobacteriaceae bacterium]
ECPSWAAASAVVRSRSSNVATVWSLWGRPHNRHTAASAAMTLDVYGRLWPSRLGEVADPMEAARQAEYQAPKVAPKPPRQSGPEL